MKYGLSESQFNEIIKIISSYPEIEELVLFGSRAINTFKEASDIDLAIKGKKVNHKLIANLKFHFEEETDLPFFFDFISYPHISNKKLKEHIDKYGIVIYRKGWKQVKLGDVVEIQNGYAFKSKDFVFDHGVPVIRIKNIASGKLSMNQCAFYSKNTDNLNNYIINSGDILTAMTGSHVYQPSSMVGRSVRYFGKQALLNQRVCKIYAKNKKKLSEDFLFYFLKQNSIVITLASNAGGSANQANISPSLIKSLTFPLPPLPEQKVIAEVLSSLDDKIELLHRQNKTLENMAQTLFHKWFIEDAANDWTTGSLGDAIDFFDNKRIPLSRRQRDEMKEGTLYPYYGAATIMDYVNNYIFDGEYILLGEDGTVRTEEGYPVLQYATGKFWVNNHAHVFQAKPPYNNFFIWLYLLRKNIDKIITGAVQPKINQTNLKALGFPKFPTDRVKTFNKKTINIFEKIKNNKLQIQTLNLFRDTLLPKVMSGNIKISSRLKV